MLAWYRYRRLAMFGTTGIAFRRLKKIFSEEVDKAGGRVRGFSGGDRWLTAKAVLPRFDEITPGDRMQAGVSVLGLGHVLGVYPYMLRKVCANGAIMPEYRSHRTMEGLDAMSPDDICWKLRKALQECCSEKAFTATTAQLRRAAAEHVGMAGAQLYVMMMAHAITRTAGLKASIMERFESAGDRSRYGLMNAVTSVARDTEDPMLRWRLERLGGDIGYGTSPVPVSEPSSETSVV
jgi:hypothetical protein